jgi:hypothetical protein
MQNTLRTQLPNFMSKERFVTGVVYTYKKFHALFVGKFMKGPLGRPKRRWEDDTEMDLQEVGCEGTYWIKLVEGRDRWRALVNAVMNLQVP